jgi:hypothetical protein
VIIADELEDFLHDGGDADHAGQGAAIASLFLKPAVGGFKGMHFKSPVQDHFEHLNIDGFGAEVMGSQGHGLEGGSLLPVMTIILVGRANSAISSSNFRPSVGVSGDGGRPRSRVATGNAADERNWRAVSTSATMVMS